MSVKAIRPDYHGDMKDVVENFHGNQLLTIGWDRNRFYATPMCIPVPPQMPFAALVEQVFPALFGQHPRFGAIDWKSVEWTRGGQPFSPVPAASLAENGLGHKAVLRFRTPELEGWLEAKGHRS